MADEMGDEVDEMAGEVKELTRAQIIGGLLICAFSFCVSHVLEELRSVQIIYLIAVKGWSVPSATLAGTLEEVAVIIASPIVGHLFDHVSKHHMVLGLSIFIMSLANMTIVISDNFWLLQARALVLGFTQATIRPGTASLAMSLMDRHHFHRWISYIQVAYFAGSVCSLTIACVVVNLLYPNVEILFVIYGIFGVVGVFCIGLVDLDEEELVVVAPRPTSKVSFCALFRDPHLVTWFGCIFCFFFADPCCAQMLNNQVSELHDTRSFMNWAYVVVLIGVAIAMLLSGFVKELTMCFGWKVVLFVGWAAMLPRLATVVLVDVYLDSNVLWLAPTALFDGISSAINNNAIMVVTHILTRDSGRFGLAQGCVSMALHAGVFAGNSSFSLTVDKPIWGVGMAFTAALLPLVGLVSLKLRSPHQDELSADGSPDYTPDSTPENSPHSAAEAS